MLWQRWLDRLCLGLAALAAAGLVAIMCGIVFQASARSLGFSAPSHIFTLSEFALLYITLLASPWLAGERGHVFIELLTAAAPQGWRTPLSRVIAALCVAVCLLLAWFTADATLHAWQRGDMDMRSFDMPRWLLLGAMPLCFGLMAAQFARFATGPAVMHTGSADSARH